MPVEKRKEFLIRSPTWQIKIEMEVWVRRVYRELDHLRAEEDCWFHPSPPSLRQNGRGKGSITHDFRWYDGVGDYVGSHCIAVNFGIVALLVENRLTEA